MKYYGVLMVLGLSIHSFISSAQKVPTEPKSPSNGQRLDEIFTYVDKLYVDPVNDKELMDAAIIGMLEKLDPHTVYIPKDEGS